MEECGSVEAAKVFRAADTCAYWLSKRNRNCLTKPVIGEAYCQVHLERAGIAHQPTDDKDQIAGASEMHHQTDADKSDERPVPVAGRCNFWLARKRRYCKLVIPANAKFCVEHSVTAEVNI
jgi:hypothetical protein